MYWKKYLISLKIKREKLKIKVFEKERTLFYTQHLLLSWICMDNLNSNVCIIREIPKHLIKPFIFSLSLRFHSAEVRVLGAVLA